MDVVYNMCAIKCEQRGKQSDEFDISTRAHVLHLVVLLTPKNSWTHRITLTFPEASPIQASIPQ